MPNSPSCVSRSRRAPELSIPHVARAPGLFQRTGPPLVCPRRVHQRPLPFSFRILLFQWRSVAVALPSQICAYVSVDPVFLCVPLHLPLMSRDTVSNFPPYPPRPHVRTHPRAPPYVLRARAFAGPSRCLATDAAAVPSSSSAPPPPADPKLNKIVDDISGLTLLQAADLVTLLKVRPCCSTRVACTSP